MSMCSTVAVRLLWRHRLTLGRVRIRARFSADSPSLTSPKSAVGEVFLNPPRGTDAKKIISQSLDEACCESQFAMTLAWLWPIVWISSSGGSGSGASSGSSGSVSF